MADWYRRFETIDAQFATVAQPIEQMTGTRLAWAATERALGFHPKQSDPYHMQIAKVKELKTARDMSRRRIYEDQARIMREMSMAAGKMEVPFILGQEGQPGWDATPEPD